MNIFKTIIFAFASLCFLVGQPVAVSASTSTSPFPVAKVQPPADVVEAMFDVPTPYKNAYSEASMKTPWLQGWDRSIFRDIKISINVKALAGSLKFHQVLIFGKKGWEKDIINTSGDIHEEYKKDLYNVIDASAQVTKIKDSRTDRLTFVYSSSVFRLDLFWELRSIDHESFLHEQDIVNVSTVQYEDITESAKWSWSWGSKEDGSSMGYDDLVFGFGGFLALGMFLDYHTSSNRGFHILDDNGYYKKTTKIYERSSLASIFSMTHRYAYSRYFNKKWENGSRFDVYENWQYAYDNSSGKPHFYLKRSIVESKSYSPMISWYPRWHWRWEENPFKLDMNIDYAPTPGGQFYVSKVPVASSPIANSREVPSAVHKTCVMQNGQLYDLNVISKLIDCGSSPVFNLYLGRSSTWTFEVCSASGSSPAPDGKDPSHVGDFSWAMGNNLSPLPSIIGLKEKAIEKRIDDVYQFLFTAIP